MNWIHWKMAELPHKIAVEWLCSTAMKIFTWKESPLYIVFGATSFIEVFGMENNQFVKVRTLKIPRHLFIEVISYCVEMKESKQLIYQNKMHQDALVLSVILHQVEVMVGCR